MEQIIDHTDKKEFDLFICDVENTYSDLFFVKDIEEKLGKYINIRYIKSNSDTAVTRNLVPGSVQLIVYINAAPITKFATGFQKINVANNGICVFQTNVDAKYSDTIMNVKSPIITDKITKAFFWAVGLCKDLNYDIIGDGFKLLNDYSNE